MISLGPLGQFPGTCSPRKNREDAMNQVLGFLESIEGAGYGGMAEFEIARMTMREEVNGREPENSVGFDFRQLSDETLESIDGIERNRRTAAINAKNIIAG